MQWEQFRLNGKKFLPGKLGTCIPELLHAGDLGTGTFLWALRAPGETDGLLGAASFRGPRAVVAQTQLSEFSGRRARASPTLPAPRPRHPPSPPPAWLLASCVLTEGRRRRGWPLPPPSPPSLDRRALLWPPLLLRPGGRAPLLARRAAPGPGRVRPRPPSGSEEGSGSGGEGSGIGCQFVAVPRRRKKPSRVPSRAGTGRARAERRRSGRGRSSGASPARPHPSAPAAAAAAPLPDARAPGSGFSGSGRGASASHTSEGRRAGEARAEFGNDAWALRGDAGRSAGLTPSVRRRTPSGCGQRSPGMRLKGSKS